MGCVVHRSKIEPEETAGNIMATEESEESEKRVSVMLVERSTLELLHDVRELPKNSYDTLTPTYQLHLGGNLSMEQVADQLERPS